MGSAVNPSLTNAEIAFSSYISSQTATYTGTIQISSAKVTKDVNVVDMNKMKAYLSYFAYGDNNYGKYNGTYWEYTSSGFIVKQEGDFYVYSNCPGYQRNEIVHCKVGDVIVMLEARGGTKTDHRNLVIAF